MTQSTDAFLWVNDELIWLCWETVPCKMRSPWHQSSLLFTMCMDLWILIYMCCGTLSLTHLLLDKKAQNGRHFTDDIFLCIFVNEKYCILIKISLTFVPRGPIDNIPALVQVMAWRRPGDKPLSEPMMGSLLTHICVTRPQWVNTAGLALRQA